MQNECEFRGPVIVHKCCRSNKLTTVDENMIHQKQQKQLRRNASIAVPDIERLDPSTRSESPPLRAYETNSEK